MISPYRHPPQLGAPTLPPLLLRPQEAANSLGVSLRCLMGWVKAGEIPVTRIGERCLRFPLDGLRAWVATRTAWPTQLTGNGTEQVAVDAANHATGGNGAASGGPPA